MHCLVPFKFIIIICGGYRTGSTLQYYLVGGYLEQLRAGRRLGLVDPDDVDRMLDQWDEPDGYIGVAKSHHVVDVHHQFRDPTAWSRIVEAGQARPVATRRDDGARPPSMCRKFGITENELETSMAWYESLLNEERWRALGAFEQQYDGLVADPVAALRELCAAIGLPWVVPPPWNRWPGAAASRSGRRWNDSLSAPTTPYRWSIGITSVPDVCNLA